ncbi:MAG: hypothetical protein HY758_03005 [Nitrospirae bacterium]|nr:hypothetical protein [Nitrospirota bacterium]
MKTLICNLAASILIVLTISSCYAARVDGPYEGRIVDADTREHIEGVVVLGTWSRVTVTPGGGVSSYYDAIETVTDKNGEFKIKGLGLKIMSNVAPMDVIIFKAGYEYAGGGPWEGLKNRGWKGYEESYDPVKKIKISREIYDPKKKVKFEGNKAIIPLKKLTLEERRRDMGTPSPPSDAAKEKISLILKEINKDRAEQGLNPIDVGR